MDLKSQRPDGAYGGLATVMSWISRVSLALAGGALVLMTVFVAWQVFGRYVLNQSPSWTEPASVMLMSWLIFLGAAVGVRTNTHLGFDVLLYVLPRGGKRVLRMISDLVVLAFGFGMIWYGSQLVGLTWNTVLPAIGLSGALDYFPVVGGGILMMIMALERIALRLSGAPIDEDIEDAPPAEAAIELENVKV
jgi:TRAP-type C4-dicarboxylate transport system permease small subunit